MSDVPVEAPPLDPVGEMVAKVNGPSGLGNLEIEVADLEDGVVDATESDIIIPSVVASKLAPEISRFEDVHARRVSGPARRTFAKG